ncbi:DUF3027 domain-containing protein [Propionimicrobium lymphophilum]|uniref:DUF3027 domain-containing protein n=1 Tax=Propionimicrobium lymphophilum TaxID=33012 RepID=UPI0003FF5063|nr:DUF3027 domain-containing protein [Propionimicrobium lymphophilum]
MAAALDEITSGAIDQAREAAEDTAKDFGVGEYLGASVEGVRQVTHYFACEHSGYAGWRWAVTMVRAARARRATVNEVVLVPSDESLRAPEWVPWADRLMSGDIKPGTLLPTPDNDPRLEPGYTGTDLNADDDPADWALSRTIAADLGLDKERVLSAEGRAQAAERWLAGRSGKDNPDTRQAPGVCLDCGYWVRLSGQLGRMFGVCTNGFSSFDATATSADHGCGGHSSVVSENRSTKLPEPVLDTMHADRVIFD